MVLYDASTLFLFYSHIFTNLFPLLLARFKVVFSYLFIRRISNSNCYNSCVYLKSSEFDCLLTWHRSSNLFYFSLFYYLNESIVLAISSNEFYKVCDFVFSESTKQHKFLYFSSSLQYATTSSRCLFKPYYNLLESY